MKAEKWIKLPVILSALAFIGAWGQVCLVYADYYKYTDSKGTVCITNKLNSVPARYRSAMKVIHEGTPRQVNGNSKSPISAAAAQGASEQTVPYRSVQPATPQQAGSPSGRIAASRPWIKPVLVVVGLVAAFLAVTKLTSLISSPQLSRLISIVFFLGLFLFTYKVYSDHLVASYFTIKTKILKMFANANVREAPENGVPAQNPEGNQPK